MKTVKFTKMVGAGNDFIVVDAQTGMNYKRLAKLICDRKTGIGADGLLVWDKSRRANYKMRIINSDGSEAEMCGNGVRCMAIYILHEKQFKKREFRVETKAGIIHCHTDGASAAVRLSEPFGLQEDIPLKINRRKIRVNYIDTGVPHVVIFVEDIDGIDVPKIGRVIRMHKRFWPKGVNVNFCEQVDRKTISVRTYERGVEDETLACGTGSAASAIITYLKANPKVTNKTNVGMKVKTYSGEILRISFDLVDRRVTNVWLKGAAKFIAKGQYYW